MSLWLTAQEVEELTGFKTPRRQKLALGNMGIKFRSRDSDGFPMVDRAQFSAHTVLTPKQRRREPHLDFLNE